MCVHTTDVAGGGGGAGSMCVHTTDKEMERGAC